MSTPGPMHTFFFADLAGFTALTEAMGDADAVDLAHAFYAAVDEVAGAYGAETVKAIGDAVMVRADHPAEAIRLALVIVHDIGGRHLFPAVRAGLHTGPAIARGGDWFGATVNLAARVSGEASGSEVLLTEATRVSAGHVPGVEIQARGRRALKNVGEPMTLYGAVRLGSIAATGLPIDPVCRMAVDPTHAVARLIHEGAEYHFCSLDCVGKVAEAPHRYTGGASVDPICHPDRGL